MITVDVDKASELSGKYKVTAMPTFLVISGKWDNKVEEKVGGGKANVDHIFAKAAEHKK